MFYYTFAVTSKLHLLQITSGVRKLEAVEAAVSYSTRSQQKIIASAFILFGLNLHSK